MRHNGPLAQVQSYGHVYDSSIAMWIPDTKTAGGGGSTQVAVSTGAVKVYQSTASDLLASVQQTSSVWQVQPGSTNWPKAAGLSVDSSNVQNFKLDGSTALTIGAFPANSSNVAVSTGRVVVQNSSRADLLGTIYQSSRADLLNTVYQSSASELKITAYQSTASDFKCMVPDESTSATLNSSSVIPTIALAGRGGCTVELQAGTLAGTLTFETSNDGGVTWTAAIINVNGRQILGNYAVTNPNARTAFDYMLGNGTSHCRVRVSVFGSGSAAAWIRATTVVSPLTVGALTVGLTSTSAPFFTNCVGGQDNAGLTQMVRMSTQYVVANDTCLSVRDTLPESTCATGLSTASGDLTVFSSASVGFYVYAYSIVLHSSVNNALRFLNGSTTVAWRVCDLGGNGNGAGSTGLAVPLSYGLAVTPPGYLFRTSTGNPVILSRSSTGNFTYAVAAFKVN